MTSNPSCIATYKGWGKEDLVKETEKEWPLTWEITEENTEKVYSKSEGI